jgi:hypothetical protein
MYSAAKDKWITLVATLDTGTPDNWICERTLEALGLEQTLKTTQVDFLVCYRKSQYSPGQISRR